MNHPPIGTPDEVARWQERWRLLNEIRDEELREASTEAKLEATARLFGAGALRRHPERYAGVPQWATTWERIRRELSAA